MLNRFQTAREVVDKVHVFEQCGRVEQVAGLIVHSQGPKLAVGASVLIESDQGELIPGEVVGFRENRVLIMAYQDLRGVRPQARVKAVSTGQFAKVDSSHLGRILNALGEPIDGGALPSSSYQVPLHSNPPSPVSRQRISEVFDCGVRSINSLLTIGVGQRVGIMAGSGVGKSTLLGMIARYAVSDINIIALIGERGREVREFIEKDLGPEGLKRSIVIVATGDTSALLRLRAAYLATAYAEYFRDQGKQVVLMVDSVTRLAMAQREIGLAVGEPPSTKGYTPSVFSLLPRLLERAGLGEGSGGITALYTVLVEGDDMNEPIADTVRGILDGHIVLSRALANRGHYPAIEILESISRVMVDITTDEQRGLAGQLREVLATYREAEDLISIGAYQSGQNKKIDHAISKIEAVNGFLKQLPENPVNFDTSITTLREILMN